MNYFLIDFAQVYRVYMIWELALMQRWVWNASSIIILADNCGCGMICHCGMSRGHCCILGTPCPVYFDSWLYLMAIWCKHVHRIELRKVFNFCATHSPVRIYRAYRDDIPDLYTVCTILRVDTPSDNYTGYWDRSIHSLLFSTSDSTKHRSKLTILRLTTRYGTSGASL